MNLLRDIIPVECIQERDIDLLILEELNCNDNFRNWFLKKTIGEIWNYEFLGGWHSLTKVGYGESDLAFMIKIKNKEIILFLIENKIDADFQPDQAGRYRLRGENRKKEGECDEYLTILIAPAKYIIQNDDFDYFIEYEEIRNWYLKHSNLGERAKYKADIFKIAIEKLRRGYQSIVDKDATTFWHYYYRIAYEKYPHLKMRKPPAGVPKGSSFFYFKPTDINLRKGDSIVHKGYGVVDLQFFGRADDIDKLIEEYKDRITSEMEFVKAKKTASLRININPIDVTGDFNDQLNIVLSAFEKADILYKWAKDYLKNYQS